MGGNLRVFSPAPKTLGLTRQTVSLSVLNIKARELIAHLQNYSNYLTLSAADHLVSLLRAVPAGYSKYNHPILETVDQLISKGLARISSQHLPALPSIIGAETLNVAFVLNENGCQLATNEEIQRAFTLRISMEIVDADYLIQHEPRLAAAVSSVNRIDEITSLVDGVTWVENNPEDDALAMQNARLVGTFTVREANATKAMRVCVGVSFVGTEEIEGVNSFHKISLRLEPPGSLLYNTAMRPYLEMANDFNKKDPRPALIVYAPVPAPRMNTSAGENFISSGVISISNAENNPLGIATLIDGRLQDQQFLSKSGATIGIQGEEMQLGGTSIPRNVPFTIIPAKLAAQGLGKIRTDSGLVIIASSMKMMPSGPVFDYESQIQLIRVVFIGVDEATTPQELADAISKLGN